MLLDDRHRKLTGRTAAGCAAHAISDDQQVIAADRVAPESARILVFLSLLTCIGAMSDDKISRHSCVQRQWVLTGQETRTPEVALLTRAAAPTNRGAESTGTAASVRFQTLSESAMKYNTILPMRISSLL